MCIYKLATLKKKINMPYAVHCLIVYRCSGAWKEHISLLSDRIIIYQGILSENFF